MFDAIARVLAGLYDLPGVGGSYGIAIVLLTLAVMTLLMPLTLRATKSTIKMQQVQPELKRIQKEYKNDREEMNREMMALYQREGINPVGGCIPMLAQLPVFLVLFNILRGLTRRREDLSYFELAAVVRGSDGSDGRSFVPRYLSDDSQMYQDLLLDDEMPFGPIDLAAQAWDVLQSNFVRALPYLVLIGAVVATSYYQQRQIQARRKSDEPMSDVMRQQQAILKFLPLMTGIWSFAFPAGLVVYWFTSNLFRIGQQSYITRKLYSDAEIPAAEKLDGDDLPSVGKGKKNKPADDDSSSKKNEKADTSASKGSNADKKRSNDKSDASDSSSSASDRTERWEARKKRAEAKRRQNTSSASASSGRTTPKGTQARPTNKKKRKR